MKRLFFVLLYSKRFRIGWVEKISNIKTAKFHNQHSKIYTFLKCSMSRWGLRTCTTAFYYPNICKLKFSVFFICFCLHDIQNTYKHTLWTNEKKIAHFNLAVLRLPPSIPIKLWSFINHAKTINGKSIACHRFDQFTQFFFLKIF